MLLLLFGSPPASEHTQRVAKTKKKLKIWQRIKHREKKRQNKLLKRTKSQEKMRENRVERELEQRTLWFESNQNVTFTPPFVPVSKSPEAGRASTCFILNTARIMSRQNSATSLQVSQQEWKCFRHLGSNTLTQIHTQALICIHRRIVSAIDSVVVAIHHTLFISLLSSWTGLSICQPQRLLSNSIKFSRQINFAFLSSFPFGYTESLMERTALLSQFLSSVECLKWPPC